MMREIRPDFGFEAGLPKLRCDVGKKLESIGLGAARRKFSPEFLNRIDRILTYRPLDDGALAEILDQHIADFQRHVGERLGPNAVDIEVPPETRRILLRKGASAAFGARELKRTLHRHLTEPLAALVAGGAVEPGCSLRLVVDEQDDRLVLQPGAGVEDDDDGY